MCTHIKEGRIDDVDADDVDDDDDDDDGDDDGEKRLEHCKLCVHT